MVAITVRNLGGERYAVTVSECAGGSEHVVTVRPEHIESYAPGADPVRLLEESFRFLLEREPKESILPEFEISVIERYFPEYGKEIAGRVSRPG